MHLSRMMLDLIKRTFLGSGFIFFYKIFRMGFAISVAPVQALL